jgi:methionyl-tRNA synthetase
MLMAAGVEVPRGVFAHGWLLVGGEKMSKSKLTGIAPTEITDVFGSDAYRFYFLSAIAFGQDGSFSWEDLSARYQAELANGFGNLASRTVAMIEKYFGGVVPAPAEYVEQDLAIQKTVADAVTRADAAMDVFRIDEAIHAIWTIVDELNGYITDNEPWALAKQADAGDEEKRARLGTVLYTCVEGLRALAVLLSPVMPQSTGKLWDALGVEESLGALAAQPIREAGAWGTLQPGTTVTALAPLFPRVEQTA